MPALRNDTGWHFLNYVFHVFPQRGPPQQGSIPNKQKLLNSDRICDKKQTFLKI